MSMQEILRNHPHFVPWTDPVSGAPMVLPRGRHHVRAADHVTPHVTGGTR